MGIMSKIFSSSDDEEEKEEEVRVEEDSHTKTIEKYCVIIGGDRITFNECRRKENHVELWNHEPYVREGLSSLYVQYNEYHKASIPWDNIDGAFNPEKLTETTYSVEYEYKEEYNSYYGSWEDFEVLESTGLQEAD